MLEVLMLEMLLERILAVRLLQEGTEVIRSGNWGGSEKFVLVSVVVDCLQHNWGVVEEHCLDVYFDTFSVFIGARAVLQGCRGKDTLLTY
jgi:hypothetical protein